MALSALIAVLLFASPVRAQSGAEGVLQGQVLNGSAGGGSVEGLEVVMRVFEGQEERDPLTAQTDAGGQFRFDGLNVGSDWVYLPRVTYEGVSYSSGIYSFTPGEDSLDVELSVYETMTDANAIRVGRAHIFVGISGDVLSVTELYVFQNLSDRTYIGTDEIEGRLWTAAFQLPPESYDLILDDGSLGGRFLADEGGFVDTEPQWPGTTQVLYTYSVACPRGVCDLSRRVTHAISDLNVLVPDAGLRVEGQQLISQGTQDAQGQTYLNYAVRNLARGQALDLSVRLPSAAASARPAQGIGVQALPWIILCTLGALAPLVYPFWRRRIEAGAGRGS